MTEKDERDDWHTGEGSMRGLGIGCSVIIAGALLILAVVLLLSRGP